MAKVIIYSIRRCESRSHEETTRQRTQAASWEEDPGYIQLQAKDWSLVFAKKITKNMQWMTRVDQILFRLSISCLLIKEVFWQKEPSIDKNVCVFFFKFCTWSSYDCMILSCWAMLYAMLFLHEKTSCSLKVTELIFMFLSHDLS